MAETRMLRPPPHRRESRDDREKKQDCSTVREMVGDGTNVYRGDQHGERQHRDDNEQFEHRVDPIPGVKAHRISSDMAVQEGRPEGPAQVLGVRS